MPNATRRPGATLADLIVALAILAIVMSMAAPRLVTARDERAASAARDAVAAVVTEARVLAVARGSARLTLDPITSRVRLESPTGTPVGDGIDVLATFGAKLVVDRVSGSVGLDFDGLGMGRLVNRTLRFRRGGAEARLSLSSYGRPRRW